MTIKQTRTVRLKQGELEDLQVGSWDECIHRYGESYTVVSPWVKRTAYILLLASAFLLGRAYGWYEVHLFIKHNAEGLAALAGTLR